MVVAADSCQSGKAHLGIVIPHQRCCARRPRYADTRTPNSHCNRGVPGHEQRPVQSTGDDLKTMQLELARAWAGTAG